MSNIPQNQVGDWLKKLEQESWQLELLVSGFTIFLLIQAISAFDEYIIAMQYQYNLSSGTLSFVFIFLSLLNNSLQALVICLIGHLLLRGFWIGTIGLRSVQSNIDFSALNYSDFFTRKLKEKVISLDQLVIKLDEICSVIFAFAFLIMSILIAFGLYLIMLGVVILFLNSLVEITPKWFGIVITVMSIVTMLTLIITGFIYLVDYFTLGYIKKIKWFSKIYYPIYKFYSIVTFSALSRSIYYYMISKFSKRKIKIVYAIGGLILFFMLIFDFDQHPYFPGDENEKVVSTNSYDNLRPSNEYVKKVSIAANYINQPHFQIFVRYKPTDNSLIKSVCEDFKPLKEDGLNWRLSTKVDGGNLYISEADYSSEDLDRLLECASSIFQISVNDSVYQDLKFYFYEHPSKKQKGMITTIPSNSFIEGENILRVNKLNPDTTQSIRFENYAFVPFWYNVSNN